MAECLPPPLSGYAWVLSQDRVNQRWLVSHRLLGSKSRSFCLYGHKLAAAPVLHYAWSEHTDISGGVCPFQWVLDAEKET